MILLRSLPIAPRVVIGIAKAAQFRNRQRGLCARLRQLRARRLRLRAQRKREQNMFEGRFRSLRLPQRRLHLRRRQLKAGPIRRRRALRRRQHLPRSRQIVQRQQNVRFQFRRLQIKNALRITFGESMQQRLGRCFIPRFMVWPSRTENPS